MKLRWLSYLGVLVIAATGVAIGPASASHVRQLSVKEVKAALDKAPSLRENGFFLLDVRSVDEHNTGAIPVSDANIAYRQIAKRHEDVRAGVGAHTHASCQPGNRSNL